MKREPEDVIEGMKEYVRQERRIDRALSVGCLVVVSVYCAGKYGIVTWEAAVPMVAAYLYWRFVR